MRYWADMEKHLHKIKPTAAIEAFAGKDNADIFILHPKGRVSDVQRRQMTTVLAPNVHNIAIKGSFDDAQAMVKRMFGDPEVTGSITLSAVNSINWARLMAQVVYYFWAALQLGAPERKVAFSVPQTVVLFVAITGATGAGFVVIVTVFEFALLPQIFSQYAL